MPWLVAKLTSQHPEQQQLRKLLSEPKLLEIHAKPIRNPYKGLYIY
jgi:hypothetical protein